MVQDLVVSPPTELDVPGSEASGRGSIHDDCDAVSSKRLGGRLDATSALDTD